MIDLHILPSVSNDKMDAIHIEEATLLNDFLSKIEQNSSFEHLIDQFDLLISHVQTHFNSEESTMQQIRFPMYRLHKGEHDKILNQIRMMHMEFRTRKDTEALKSYLEDEFSSWLDQHIKAMDIVLANAMTTL